MHKRLIFYGGTRENNANGTLRQKGIADNSAFKQAALNVAKDYADWVSSGEIVKITTAKDVVGKTNALKANSIKSLDIISHGTPVSLNFSIKENENCGFFTNRLAAMFVEAYYENKFSAEARSFGDIDFSKFTLDARIQIHGCNTAKQIGIPGQTLVELLSAKLSDAGKVDAIVIGHTDKISPMIGGKSTKIKEQDYRHGQRAIYHNGKILFETSKKGLISDKEIGMKLAQKVFKGIRVYR